MRFANSWEAWIYITYGMFSSGSTAGGWASGKPRDLVDLLVDILELVSVFTLVFFSLGYLRNLVNVVAHISDTLVMQWKNYYLLMSPSPFWSIPWIIASHSDWSISSIPLLSNFFNYSVEIDPSLFVSKSLNVSSKWARGIYLCFKRA